jgi:hypothetical protein
VDISDRGDGALDRKSIVKDADFKGFQHPRPEVKALAEKVRSDFFPIYRSAAVKVHSQDFVT